MAGDEAAGSRLRDDVGVTPTSPSSITIAGAWDCADGLLCLWVNPDFAGYKPSFWGGGCQNLGPFGINDQASSWHNRYSGSWTLYRGSDCTGDRFVAPSGARAGQMGSYWNDNISSICRSDTICP